MPNPAATWRRTTACSTRSTPAGYAAAGLGCQVYRNPDGTLAALLLNETGSEVVLNIVGPTRAVALRLPARSIQSVLWED